MNNNSAQNDKAVDNASAATPNTSTNSEPASKHLPPHLREQTEPNDHVKKEKFEEVPVQALGDDVPNPIQRFGDLTLPPNLLTQIEKQYDRSPTPIQKYAMPVIMEGRDLVALAPTGSGKTLAYLAPVIAKLSQQTPKTIVSGGPITCECLILAPTRELAMGIHYEACKWTSLVNLKCHAVFGGVSMQQQIESLVAGCDILVATPGRLQDLIERGCISMSNIKCLCLDEADRMLDMGFEPQIRSIVESKGMPAVGMRQTLIFSATYSKNIQALVQDFLTDYIHLRLGMVGPGSASTTIKQTFRHVEQADKRAALVDALNCTQGLVLVFVSTKRAADDLENYLVDSLQLPATCIHGNINQAERQTALQQLLSGERTILVCTDIAVRGLDLANVSHVINYDLPCSIDNYVFRLGRAVRGSKEGFATSFFNEENKALAKDIVQVLQDSDQEVPDWLQEFANGTGGAQRGGSDRGGRGRPSRGRGFVPRPAPKRGDQNNEKNGDGDKQDGW